MKKWARRRQKFSRLAGKMLFRGLKIIRKVHDFNKNKKINQKIFSQFSENPSLRNLETNIFFFALAMSSRIDLRNIYYIVFLWYALWLVI